MNPTSYLGRGADGNRNRVSKGDSPLHPSIEGVAIRMSIRGIQDQTKTTETRWAKVQGDHETRLESKD